MSEVMIRVEVAYALPERQKLVELCVERGCTALQAARRSGLERTFPEIDWDQADLGIFSQPLDGTVLPRAADYVLEDGDRVEVYRPLLNDPKLARVRKAAQARKGSKKGW